MSDAQEVCLQLDNGDSLGINTAQDLVIYNTWSMAHWVKGDTTSSTFDLSFTGAGSKDSADISIITRTSSSLVLNLWDKTGQNFYQATYDADLSPDVWHHVVLVWDGFLSNVSIFVDGEFVEPASVSIDLLPAALRGTFRTISFSSSSDNVRFYSSAIWDVPLTGFDVQEIYNEGSGSDIDLVSNSGTYTKGLNLRHWWKFGFEPGNLGRDFGLTYNLINMMADFTGIDDSNIAVDFPGM